MRTILASASPRRRELLEQMGIAFEVRPAKGKESITKTTPEEIVQELAYQKAIEVADLTRKEKIPGAHEEDTVRIIGSDTIVVYKGEVFGKPKDDQDALRMLTSLQGDTHQVYTGVCVIDLSTQEEDKPFIKTFAEKTDVVMYPVSEQEIRDYIATGEPMDKAGAYAIQGLSAKFIKEINGDYYNVVGLPMARLYQECYK